MRDNATELPLGLTGFKDRRGTARDLPRAYDDMTTETVQPLFADNT